MSDVKRVLSRLELDLVLGQRNPLYQQVAALASRLAEAEQEIRRLNDVVRAKEGNADAARQNAAGWKQYAERAEQRAAEAERRVKEL